MSCNPFLPVDAVAPSRGSQWPGDRRTGPRLSSYARMAGPEPSESGAVLAPPSSVLAPPSNSIPAFILPFILPYTFPFFPAGEAGQSDGGSGAHRHPGGNR
jgi:hypothetical protein